MSVDFGVMEPTIRRWARAAEEHGHLDEPEGETMLCGCGYEGAPEAIIRYSEWDAADEDRDTFICAGCGGA